jgi:hypothetical protein
VPKAARDYGIAGAQMLRNAAAREEKNRWAKFRKE